MGDGSLEVSCSACGATLVVPAGHRTARCAYCDSPSVVDRPATDDRPDPVFVIGFSVDRARAVGLLRTDLAGRRWAPTAVRQAAADRVEGVYLPAYLYSAVADTRYRAMIGENYTETRYDARKKSMRRVTKTEHRPLQGVHRCFVEDLLVTASAGIPNAELEAVEPFDLGELRRYQPATISGWVAEEASLSRAGSLELARAEATAQVRARLGAFMPGDSHHSLVAETGHREEAMDLVLLPVWVCAVGWRDDRPPIRLLVNGQTGRVAGATPVSWAKIAAVVAGSLALLGLAGVLGTLLGWFS